VDGPAGARLARPYQHVNPRDVTKLQAERLGRVRNAVQVFSTDGDIDVPRQATGIRFDFLDIQVDGESTNDAVFDSGRLENLLHQLRQIEELFHTLLKEPVDNDHRLV
jgi:hypothetical protein